MFSSSSKIYANQSCKLPKTLFNAGDGVYKIWEIIKRGNNFLMGDNTPLHTMLYVFHDM